MTPTLFIMLSLTNSAKYAQIRIEVRPFWRFSNDAPTPVRHIVAFSSSVVFESLAPLFSLGEWQRTILRSWLQTYMHFRSSSCSVVDLEVVAAFFLGTALTCRRRSNLHVSTSAGKSGEFKRPLTARVLNYTLPQLPAQSVAP